MPDESKKNQQKKGKNEPKEQRKQRQTRHNKPLPDNVEKRHELPKEPEKPAVEEPGPEFYKNLKRETDEILKITEEANSKYNKKEIQSNWKKYEIPIETYDEIEEQENMGADYEKLVQMPMSAGGHFQFKHEKSWDSANAPSEYDKYFNIDMDNLTIALCTIPFYERNNINASIFSETDINSMNNRATKYKQKYYNDKSFTTPELEASEIFINTLKEGITVSSEKDFTDNKLDVLTRNLEIKHATTEKELKHDKISNELSPNTEVTPVQNRTFEHNRKEHDFDDIIGTEEITKETLNFMVTEDTIGVKESVLENKTTKTDASEESATQAVDTKKPVIESPEDLEKWLDDFLDD